MPNITHRMYQFAQTFLPDVQHLPTNTTTKNALFFVALAGFGVMFLPQTYAAVNIDTALNNNVMTVQQVLVPPTVDINNNGIKLDIGAPVGVLKRDAAGYIVQGYVVSGDVEMGTITCDKLDLSTFGGFTCAGSAYSGSCADIFGPNSFLQGVDTAGNLVCGSPTGGSGAGLVCSTDGEIPTWFSATSEWICSPPFSSTSSGDSLWEADAWNPNLIYNKNLTGNVGVGLTNPTETLHVSGTFLVQGSGLIPSGAPLSGSTFYAYTGIYPEFPSFPGGAPSSGDFFYTVMSMPLCSCDTNGYTNDCAITGQQMNIQHSSISWNPANAAWFNHNDVGLYCKERIKQGPDPVDGSFCPDCGSYNIYRRAYIGSDGVSSCVTSTVSTGATPNSSAVFYVGTSAVGVLTKNPQYALDVVGYIRAYGFVTYSDARLKTDISPITNALEKIAGINGYAYTLITNGSKQYGVLAQEVEGSFPDAVSTTADGYKAVNYNALIAPTIQAIHELDAKVQRLEDTYKSNETRIQHIESLLQ